MVNRGAERNERQRRKDELLNVFMVRRGKAQEWAEERGWKKGERGKEGGGRGGDSGREEEEQREGGGE